MKKILLFVLTLCATVTLFAQTFTYNGINYTVTSASKVEVSWNTGIMGAAVIPSTVTYLGSVYEVIGIGQRAFTDCASLTSITIPNSVTTIGYSAFSDCRLLTSITIPNSVTTIGYWAFQFCTSLTSITIPNSVTTIGDSAFAQCYSLTSITIPNSVTTFGNWAFSGCTSLTSITIPNSVTGIAYSAFSYCTSLTSVTIPNSVTSIGAYAFSNCTSLPSVTIPNTVTSIGGAAFFNCTSLTSVTIPNSVTTIGNSAFQLCYSLTSITIPNSVTTIGDVTFSSCTSLTSVIIPNSVTTIGNSAFELCYSLTSITIPNSVTTIGNFAFSACPSLTSISIPNSVTTIGDGAFSHCHSLKPVTVNWATPLRITASVFRGIPPMASKTLYVPAGTLAAYKAAPVWKEFGTIIELGTLPLTLNSLTAKAIAAGNQINWLSQDVVNVKNIVLERSGADNIFSHLVTLPLTAKQFIDFNPLAGDNYYRFSTIDNDGYTKTYPIIAFVKGLGSDITFYPNPITKGELHIVAGNNKLQSVSLFDMNGKKVVFVNNPKCDKNIIVNTEKLINGVYMLETVSEKGKVLKKVVVN
ncbi:MAG: T9SS C-terminal target domain-containing protein [Sphingobacteriales bacterium]|nr:MAG: T9SS C-terminal target domain-containing protein [Sphingobacteriales bacterium]